MPTKQVTVKEWLESLEQRFPAGQAHALHEITKFLVSNPEPTVVRRVAGADARYELLNEDYSNWYEVDMDECESAAQLVEWIGHILDKTWVTKTHLKQFIDIVTKDHPEFRDRGN
jgi:hypothetical protein